MGRSESWLYTILVCSVTGERLRLLDPVEVASINSLIEAGDARRRNGSPPEGTMDEGLLAQESGYIYPVRGDIPFLLPDDAIAVPL
jgi:uncharacterized protein YbaR (Trm112 family)